MVYCRFSIVKKMASQLSSKGEISTETVPWVCVEWKVPDTHFLPQDTEHRIYSPNFDVKDVAWCLRLTIHERKRVPYPSHDPSYDYIGLHLVKKDPNSSAHPVKYHVGIKTVNGNSHRSVYGSEPYWSRHYWGGHSLIRRSELSEKKTSLAPNGVVRFFCHFGLEPGGGSYVTSAEDQLEMIASENIGEISIEMLTMMYVEWKVQDMHLLSEDTMHRIRSASFQFNDETWRLQATIHDTEFRGKGTLGPIDLHLLRMDCAIPTLRVDCEIGIKLSDGDAYRTRQDILIFDRDADCHVWTDLLSRLDEKIFEAPNGDVTFFCCLLLESAENLDAVSTAKTSEDLQKLGADFKNLFITGEDSDVTIKVKNKEFKAHKNILRARSTVFHSIVTHDMAEKNSGTVDIVDCDPNAFEIFLLYLYSGNVENLSTNTVFGLYKAADKYDSKELKLQCKDFMVSNLSVDSVCDVIEHALQYDETELLKTATVFIAKNLKNVILTVKWQSLMKKNAVAANEIIIEATKYFL